MPTGAFNICCPRDCVSRHNGGTSGVPLKPLRDDSALIYSTDRLEGSALAVYIEKNKLFRLIESVPVEERKRRAYNKYI